MRALLRCLRNSSMVTKSTPSLLSRPTFNTVQFPIGRVFSSDIAPDSSEHPLLVSSRSGDALAMFHYALHLEKISSNVEHTPQAATATEVIQEIKMIQTKAKKKKKLMFNSKKGSLSTVALDDDDISKQGEPNYWLRLSFEHGNLDAGVSLANKLFSKEDKSSVLEAIEIYLTAAEIGHPDACFNLGNLYFNGSDVAEVPIDLPRSLSFFEKGAALGDSSCLYWLGHCYAAGEGGVSAINMTKAIDLLERASSKGHPAAHYYLSMIWRNRASDNTENMSKFHHHLQLAYELGDADAAYCLFDVHREGSDGYCANIALSKKYLIAAIDRGHADAASSLGSMYYFGSMGYPEDKSKAFELYNLAADRGCNDAWRNLASMYALGDGVTKCESTAKYIMKTVFGEENAQFKRLVTKKADGEKR